MMLSRMFSLALGTTLFVLIWTMQDGNHSAPRMSVALRLRSIAQEAPAQPVVQSAPSSVALPTVAKDETSSPTANDHELWIFAAEPPAQVAVK